jgi:hypothetical protein
MVLLRRHSDHTHGPITRGVVVNLSFLTAFLLFHLVLAQIERVVCTGGRRIRRGSMRAHEEGERVAERRGEHIGCAVEDRAWAAARDRGHVESFGAPVSATSEGGVALEVDREVPRSPIVAEAGERV